MAEWLGKLVGRPVRRVPGLIYVKLPLAITPIERGERFEDPIDHELQKRRLGSVSGGGTLVSPPDDDGKKTIIYCGVDVEADDLDKVRSLLREILPSLGAPNQTALQYEVGDDLFEDVFSNGEWILAASQQTLGKDKRRE